MNMCIHTHTCIYIISTIFKLIKKVTFVNYNEGTEVTFVLQAISHYFFKELQFYHWQTEEAVTFLFKCLCPDFAQKSYCFLLARPQQQHTVSKQL